MKCSLKNCPGQYESRQVVHPVRQGDELIVIDHVPAEVCDTCADVLLTSETVRHIEALLQQRPRPARTAPVYEFA